MMPRIRSLETYAPSDADSTRRAARKARRQAFERSQNERRAARNVRKYVKAGPLEIPVPQLRDVEWMAKKTCNVLIRSVFYIYDKSESFRLFLHDLRAVLPLVVASLSRHLRYTITKWFEPKRPDFPKPSRRVRAQLPLPPPVPINWLALIEYNSIYGTSVHKFDFDAWGAEVQRLAPCGPIDSPFQQSDAEEEMEVESMLVFPESDTIGVCEVVEPDPETYRRSMSEDRDIPIRIRNRLRYAERLGIQQDQACYHPYNYDPSSKSRKEILRKHSRGCLLVSRFWDYELKWRVIEDKIHTTLNFSSIPWPVHLKSTDAGRTRTPIPTPADVTRERVIAFMMYSILEPYTLCLYRNPAQLKAIIRHDIRMRWSQKRFSELVLSRIQYPREEAATRVAANIVLNALIEMTTSEFWNDVSLESATLPRMEIENREFYMADRLTRNVKPFF